MAEEGVAEEGVAEAHSVDNQRLRWTVRCAECGGGHKLLRHEWLGNIERFEQYQRLVEWSVRCRNAGEMLAVPRELCG